MSLVLECVKNAMAKEKLERPVVNGGTLTDNQKRELYLVKIEASEIAMALADSDYSENPQSDYQFLMRNAFFRRDIAFAAKVYEPTKKAQEETSGYHEKMWRAHTDENIIRQNYQVKGMGMEQLVSDPQFRKLVSAQNPDLLAALDESVHLDKDKPYLSQLNQEQKLKMVFDVMSNAEVGRAASLAFKFFKAVMPNFFANGVVLVMEKTQDQAGEEILAKLKAKVPQQEKTFQPQ